MIEKGITSKATIKVNLYLDLTKFESNKYSLNDPEIEKSTYELEENTIIAMKEIIKNPDYIETELWEYKEDEGIYSFLVYADEVYGTYRCDYSPATYYEPEEDFFEWIEIDLPIIVKDDDNFTRLSREKELEILKILKTLKYGEYIKDISIIGVTTEDEFFNDVDEDEEIY